MFDTETRKAAIRDIIYEKKEKINIDLGVNKMIGNVIAIEALKERAKNISNNTTDIKRKIKRFGG